MKEIHLIIRNSK